MSRPPPPEPPAPEESLNITTELLRRAKDGDRVALDSLMARYLPRLRSWASGRLPMRARSLVETGDLVQETLLRTIERLDHVEVRGPGGFQAYVRSAVLNRIRDHIRYVSRRPGPDGIPEDLVDPGPSPLELAMGAEVVARYERALARLTPDEQQLLHLRLELDYDYGEIASMTERPSRDAARMAVTRALRRLAEVMGHDS
jgi:RNA polymerase sigma-70 factor (ECF subfamily)